MAVGYLLNSTGWATTGDKAQLDITGDIDLIICIAPDSWATGVNQSLIVKNTNYLFRINGAGSLALVWDPGGGNIGQTSATIPSVVAGEPKWLRAILDVDDGASGHFVSWQHSNDPEDTPVGSVTWTEFDTDTGAGTTTLVGNGDPLYVGANHNESQPSGGKVYLAHVYDGRPATFTDPPSGTRVANPDWRTDDQGWSSLPGTDDEGNDWSFGSGASWVAPAGRLVGRSVHYNFDSKTKIVESGV